MRLTISITAPSDTSDQDLLTLDLSDDMTIADLKALIESETKFASSSQHLYHNGRLLADGSATLQALRLADGDMLAMHVREMASQPGAASNREPGAAARGSGATALGSGTGGPRGGGSGGRSGPDPEMIRLQILGNPQARADVQRRNPELAAAVDNAARFREVWDQLQERQAAADARQREIAGLIDDPFNPEAQARIEELIRQEAVMENLQNAVEQFPEAFGKVHMLYIDVEVNGHKVKAFVDSGAQTTIMSPSCAEACGIMRLVDRRFSGIARGVGTANIIGRVHLAQIKIGTSFLDCTFTVMEGKDVDLLLGLDMLKRHQARIDLRKGVLEIQGDEVPFLGEADIPKTEEDRLLSEPTLQGPGNTRVGARSGAVTQAAADAPASAAAVAASPNFQGEGHTLGAPASASSSQAPSSSLSAQANPQQQPSSAGAQAQSQQQHPPEAIEQLQQLGFSREQAIAALNAAGGNVDYAAGLLFQ